MSSLATPVSLAGPMSTSAASHLSPAFPMRAPWGTASALRAWQQEALDAYLARTGPMPRDFLAVATPGAGKTTFALRVASELLERRLVDAVTVVAPTEHLKHQWADAASRVGIALDPSFRNAQGAVGQRLHRRRRDLRPGRSPPAAAPAPDRGRRTLVILDEVHHGGDALSWGDAVREAFEPAARRLALTGHAVPLRHQRDPVRHATPQDGDGVRRSAADYSYGYGRALADGVVRPVIFLSYSGQMRWRTRAGDEISATLGEPLTKDVDRAGLADRAGPARQLDPAGARGRRPAAHRGAPRRAGRRRPGHRHRPRVGPRLRRTAAPDHRRGADGRAVRRGRRQRPDRGVRRLGDDRWMVAVRMVSEGVDVPRLAVGVYATSTATPLFFAQAVGRFVRARRRGETASVFLPSVPLLLQHAAEMEVERDHALDRPPTDDDESSSSPPRTRCWRQANRARHRGRRWTSCPFEALEAEAHFDRVLFDGGEFGTQAARRLRGRGRLPGPARAAGAGPGDHAAAGPAERARRPGGREPARRAGGAGGGGAPGGPGAAQGAQRAGRRLAPPHRHPARRGAHRAASGVRRAAGRPGERRAAAGPDRPDPHAGRCAAADGQARRRRGRCLVDVS